MRLNKGKKADQFRKRNLMKKCLTNWKLFTEGQRRIREVKEEKTKMEQMLTNLKSLSKNWHRQKGGHAKKNSNRKLSLYAKQSFNEQWGLESQANMVIVEDKETKTKSLMELPKLMSPKTSPRQLKIKARNGFLRNGSISLDSLNRNEEKVALEMKNQVIQAQRKRLREQEKEIQELRKLKRQLEMGRSVTNKGLYDVLVRSESKFHKNYEITSNEVWNMRKKPERNMISFRNTKTEKVKEPRNIVITKKEGSSQEVARKYDKIKGENKGQKGQEKKKDKKKIVKSNENRNTSNGFNDNENRLKNLNDMADEYFNRKLLVRYGLQPWVQLCSDNRLKSYLADKLYEDRLLRRYFGIWRSRVEVKISPKVLKVKMAKTFRRKSLLQLAFGRWKRVTNDNIFCCKFRLHFK